VPPDLARGQPRGWCPHHQPFLFVPVRPHRSRLIASRSGSQGNANPDVHTNPAMKLNLTLASTPITRTTVAALITSASLFTYGPIQGAAANDRLVATQIAPVPPAQPPLYAQTPGVIFSERLEPALLGYTFDYDPATGSYVIRRPLFATTLSDLTGPPDEFQAKFGSMLNSSRVYLNDSTEAGIEATNGLAQVAASFSLSDEAKHSVLGTTFRLTAEADFPMAATNFLTLPQAAYDPTAWNILHMPGGTPQADLARTDAWFAAGFGEFVAFGYDLRGFVDVVFTMNQTSDYRAFEEKFNLMASYSTVTATLDIVKKMKQSLETGELSFALETQGCNPPHLPSVVELSTQQGQIDYANELNDHASNCKHHVGLYLISAFALPNGPAINVPTWDDAVLSAARVEVDNAVRTLFAASRWNFSWRIMQFMAHQMRPYPNVAQSFDSAMLLGRQQIAAQLGSLRDALKAYGDPENVMNTAVSAAVLTAAADVHNATVALQDVLSEVEVRIAMLPAMQFTLTDGMTPVAGSNALCNTWVTVQVSNVGLFSSLTNPEIEAFLAHGTPYTETLFFDEYVGQSYGTHAWSNGGIPTIDLLEIQPIVSGSGAGLYNIKFDMIVANMFVSATNVRLRLIDDINRPGSTPYNMAW